MQNDANLGFDALLTYVVGYTQVLYFAASVTASGIHLLGLVAESNLLWILKIKIAVVHDFQLNDYRRTGLPLTGGRIIHQKIWPKRQKLDGPAYEYAQN